MARDAAQAQAKRDDDNRANMARRDRDVFLQREANARAVANNTFNWQLAEYRKATARLARYRLADGRPEVWEDQPTGEYDEEGNEVMESVLVQSAIDPLDAQVEQPVYDEETGEQSGTATVNNPLIVQDDAERAEAQAVVDATPEEVKAFEQ